MYMYMVHHEESNPREGEICCEGQGNVFRLNIKAKFFDKYAGMTKYYLNFLQLFYPTTKIFAPFF